MIYVYHCDHCNTDSERVCSLAAYEKEPTYMCPHCWGPTRQKLCVAHALLHTGQFTAFQSTVDGSIISSRRDLAEHNRRNNVVNLHDGYDEKAVQAMTKKDYQAPLDQERRKDLKMDVEKAIAMCTDGYTPQRRREDDPP